MKKVIPVLLAVVSATLIVAIPVRAEDTTLAQRLEQYKDAYPQNLTDDQLAAISAACPRAKSALSDLPSRLAATKLTYVGAYSLVDARLTAIQKRLNLQHIDTSTIDLLLANYRRSIQRFEAAVDNYEQALRDIEALDCSDAVGFEASLQAIRGYQADSVKSAGDIAAYLKTNLVQSFSVISKTITGGDN